MGFETDFAVTPWLKENLEFPLAANEVIIGSNVVPNPDSTINFFNQKFTVKGQLDESGMGYDDTAFMNIEDVRRLTEAAQNSGMDIPESLDDSVSAVMVDVADDYDAQEALVNLIAATSGQDLRVIKSSKIIDTTSGQIKQSSNYLFMLLAIIWLLGLVVLIILFPLLINSRTAEFMALRILGSTKKQLQNLVLKESLILGLIGAAAGTVFGLLVTGLFKTALHQKLNLPFLPPQLGTIILLATAVILLCSILCPFSSLWAISRMNRKEIAIASRENE